MNSADIPLHITPAGDYGWDMARLAVIVAVLTSASWAWILYDERAEHERQLAEIINAPLKLSRPRMLTIEYDSGAKVKIAIKEVQP